MTLCIRIKFALNNNARATEGLKLRGRGPVPINSEPYDQAVGGCLVIKPQRRSLELNLPHADDTYELPVICYRNRRQVFKKHIAVCWIIRGRKSRTINTGGNGHEPDESQQTRSSLEHHIQIRHHASWNVLRPQTDEPVTPTFGRLMDRTRSHPQSSRD